MPKMLPLLSMGQQVAADEKLPCLYCGQGEEIVGGYICVACEFNAQAGIFNQWQVEVSVFRDAAIAAKDGARNGFHYFTCVQCHRALSEVLGLPRERQRRITCPYCLTTGPDKTDGSAENTNEPSERSVTQCLFCLGPVSEAHYPLCGECADQTPRIVCEVCGQDRPQYRSTMTVVGNTDPAKRYAFASCGVCAIDDLLGRGDYFYMTPLQYHEVGRQRLQDLRNQR